MVKGLIGAWRHDTSPLSHPQVIVSISCQPDVQSISRVLTDKGIEARSYKKEQEHPGSY
jgi:hypothetical protein